MLFVTLIMSLNQLYDSVLYILYHRVLDILKSCVQFMQKKVFFIFLFFLFLLLFFFLLL